MSSLNPTRLHFTDFDEPDWVDDARAEARAARAANRRYTQLAGMHPNDPEFDPDEFDALEESLCQQRL